LLLAENEQFDEATKELEKLRKLDPKDMLTLLQLAMLYSAQKQSDKAIETYDALLAEQPDEWRALRGRGDAYLNVGKHAEAIADYEKAFKLQPKDSGILNNFAWVLATSPDDKLRDGKRAIPLATEACEATEYKLPHILSTLAAAYAETGDFDSAVKWSAKAVEIGDKKFDEALKKELENYKAKKPWRELLSEGKPVEK
jgi:tetratricopeptide (TPR) repeat protein